MLQRICSEINSSVFVDIQIKAKYPQTKALSWLYMKFDYGSLLNSTLITLQQNQNNRQNKRNIAVKVYEHACNALQLLNWSANVLTH